MTCCSPDEGLHTPLLFNGGISPFLLPWQRPLPWMNSQKDTCESSFAEWNHAAFSRTTLGCPSLTSAFRLCPQCSCMKFPGLLKNMSELPSKDREIAQLQGCHKHVRHRLPVEGLHIWLVPKMHVSQENCEGQTQSFQEKQPEEITAFPGPGKC